jgi:hypothetical protein
VQPCNGDHSEGRKALNPFSAPGKRQRAPASPAGILFEEFRWLKPSLSALGIGFFISRTKTRGRGDFHQKPAYFACRYDAGSLARVNVIAFCSPLIADWELMGADVHRYRQRIKSAMREEMIHAIQLLAVKKRFEDSAELRERFPGAETYYQHLLGRTITELTANQVGERAILTAAKLYYEDWTINSLDQLKDADRRYHGQEGYLVCELIRQVTQIRFGELMSEEAKGSAWDKNRIFSVGEYGSTENLMMAMAATLRQSVPQLVDLSPTLTEALNEIETTIETIGEIAGAMLSRFNDCACSLLAGSRGLSG